MANDKSTIWIIGIILAVALFYQYSGFFGITLTSSSTQYYNKPLEIIFKTSNFTQWSDSCAYPQCGPSVRTFFNDYELFNFMINEYGGENITLSNSVVNGSFTIIVEGLKEEGVFKIVLKENNKTETQIVNVEQPYVDLTHNIPNTAEEGDTLKISIQTFNPQGDILDADSVLIDVTNPDNSVDTLTLIKSGGSYEYNFNYEDAGTYLFKIRASELNYKTKEVSAVTAVISTGGIPLIMWIWIGAIIFWIILFGIKFVRTR